MKTTKLLLAIACVLAPAASGFGQSLQTKTPGILGYLDPKTGTFRVLPMPESGSTDVQPLTASTGKIVVSFTITVSSAIAASAKIECGASASIVEVSVPFETVDSAAVVATRSGGTATCTVNIPYSWNLATPGSDVVVLAYEINAPVEVSPTAAASFPQRQTIGWIADIPVPANGATTNETVTATF